MAPISVPRQRIKLIDRVSAINWNKLEDDKDLEVWDSLAHNERGRAYVDHARVHRSHLA